jgi:hypothetical protein
MRVATVLCLAGMALVAAACGGSDTKVLCPSGCNNPVHKPTQIIVTCADANTVVKGITWKSYGDKTAEGSGTANVNACDPNCAAGKFQQFPATVKLSNPKDCAKDRTQFTHLELTYTGAKPPSGSSTISEDFPCNGP